MPDPEEVRLAVLALSWINTEAFDWLTGRAIYLCVCVYASSEVAALEALVERYQDELHAMGTRRPHSSNRAARYTEELFEHQRLYPSGWETRLLPDDKPPLCRRNGEESGFAQVSLPTRDWEWVTNWCCEVSAKTDESGWSYASSWERLDDFEFPPNR